MFINPINQKSLFYYGQQSKKTKKNSCMQSVNFQGKIFKDKGIRNYLLATIALTPAVGPIAPALAIPAYFLDKIVDKSNSSSNKNNDDKKNE